MPRLQLYLSEKELKYAKEQGEGYVRQLIVNDMGPRVPGGDEWLEREEGVVPKKNTKVKKVVLPKEYSVVSPLKTVKGDGLHTCKKCGYMLPFYKGKCKNGCK